MYCIYIYVLYIYIYILDIYVVATYLLEIWKCMFCVLYIYFDNTYSYIYIMYLMHFVSTFLSTDCSGLAAWPGARTSERSWASSWSQQREMDHWRRSSETRRLDEDLGCVYPGFVRDLLPYQWIFCNTFWGMFFCQLPGVLSQSKLYSCHRQIL